MKTLLYRLLGLNGTTPTHRANLQWVETQEDTILCQQSFVSTPTIKRKCVVRMDPDMPRGSFRKNS